MPRVPVTPPHWSRWQNAVAVVLLLIAVALFVVASISEPVFGKRIDFGILPATLLGVSLYVIFGINVMLRLIEKSGEK